MAKCISYAVFAADDAGVADAISPWYVSWPVSTDDAEPSGSEFSDDAKSPGSELAPETDGTAGERYPGQGKCV
jgi:hypothetical protein